MKLKTLNLYKNNVLYKSRFNNQQGNTSAIFIGIIAFFFIAILAFNLWQSHKAKERREKTQANINQIQSNIDSLKKSEPKPSSSNGDTAQSANDDPRKVADVVSQLSKRMPYQTGDFKFERIYQSSGIVFEVSFDKKAVQGYTEENYFIHALKASLTEQCHNQNISFFIDKGHDVIFEVKDIKGQHVLTHRLNPTECNTHYVFD